MEVIFRSMAMEAVQRPIVGGVNCKRNFRIGRDVLVGLNRVVFAEEMFLRLHDRDI